MSENTQNKKTVIVTGSGQGIGKSIALVFAENNYNVVISDINLENAKKVEEEIKSKRQSAVVIGCDVSKIEDIKNLVKKTLEVYPEINVLVNNAGIFPFKPFLEITEEDWDKVLDINLKGLFFLSQEVVKVMPENSKIVDVSSIASVVGFAGLTHYCASKGGLNSLIRAIALELTTKNITVNAVAPGLIDTPGTNSTSMNEEVKQQLLSAIPMRRSGKPEEIANVALFLASDKASYITGQTIIVDGGWTLQ